MPHIIKYLFFICTFLCFSKGIALETEWGVQNESKLRLISPLTTNNNQNEIYVGLEYKLQEGWKTYWKSPGDGGFPQSINWKQSKNVKSLDILWPTPKKFEILGIQSLGYENNVIFPLKIVLENSFDTTLIILDINFLVCKDICIPGIANLRLSLPPGSGKLTKHTYALEKALSKIPSQSSTLSFVNNVDSKIFYNDKFFSFIINAEAKNTFKNPSVFLHTEYGLPVIDPKIFLSADSKFLKAEFIFDINLLPNSNDNVSSQFLISDQSGSFIIDSIIKEKNRSQYLDNSLLYIILIAFVGGLILNAMPCVLPVLSIKILSLLDHIEKPLSIRKSFFITSFGIISSFLLLALIFIFLRYLGINIGWGMQFQQPIFLMIISIILVFFALNLFGFFEISLPNVINNKLFIQPELNNNTGDFLKGFFATLMATPCSAPFVGSAITFAFTQSAIAMFFIFLFMGIGMSFPYLLVAAAPKALYFFPKPGKWMIYLKYLMGLLLLATLVWIGNILLNYFNLYFISSALLILLLTLFLSYFFRFKKTIFLISIIVFFSLTNFSFFNSSSTIKDSDWLNFNLVSIQDLVKKNDIIFVDITADWCATCQYNKINVLNTNKTKEIFSKLKVVKVRGDWTKPNDKIYNFLKDNNKFGIPFNVFFSQQHPEGIILSELLTYNEIEGVLKKIK